MTGSVPLIDSSRNGCTCFIVALASELAALDWWAGGLSVWQYLAETVESAGPPAIRLDSPVRDPVGSKSLASSWPKLLVARGRRATYTDKNWGSSVEWAAGCLFYQSPSAHMELLPGFALVVENCLLKNLAALVVEEVVYFDKIDSYPCDAGWRSVRLAGSWNRLKYQDCCKLVKQHHGMIPRIGERRVCSGTPPAVAQCCQYECR